MWHVYLVNRSNYYDEFPRQFHGLSYLEIFLILLYCLLWSCDMFVCTVAAISCLFCLDIHCISMCYSHCHGFVKSKLGICTQPRQFVYTSWVYCFNRLSLHWPPEGVWLGGRLGVRLVGSLYLRVFVQEMHQEVIENG